MGVMESEGITAQQHWANTAELACPPFFVGQAIGPITCYPSSGGSPAATGWATPPVTFFAGPPEREEWRASTRRRHGRGFRDPGAPGGLRIS